jgi:hypothetical protein
VNGLKDAEIGAGYDSKSAAIPNISHVDTRRAERLGGDAERHPATLIQVREPLPSQ